MITQMQPPEGVQERVRKQSLFFSHVLEKQPCSMKGVTCRKTEKVPGERGQLRQFGSPDSGRLMDKYGYWGLGYISKRQISAFEYHRALV